MQEAILLHFNLAHPQAKLLHINLILMSAPMIRLIQITGIHFKDAILQIQKIYTKPLFTKHIIYVEAEEGHIIKMENVSLFILLAIHSISLEDFAILVSMEHYLILREFVGWVHPPRLPHHPPQPQPQRPRLHQTHRHLLLLLNVLIRRWWKWEVYAFMEKRVVQVTTIFSTVLSAIPNTLLRLAILFWTAVDRDLIIIHL